MAEGLLATIVAAKRAELRERFDGIAIDALRARTARSNHSLASAVAKPGARFILEIKKASPSLGAIRPAADVAALATGYAPIADTLSVLTDSPFFGGSIDDLRSARAHFPGPILAKDFFIDPRQVAEARIAGADAILVMLSVLDDEEARAMVAEANLLGMDALVEVHQEAEMRRALALGAPLIGINNRDLRDLTIDLATTERLAPLAGGRLLVSESGIAGRGDVDRLASHVDGFLVGSALMRSLDPPQAARELVFGRVKLCGLNQPQDVAAGSAACFAGFVFVPDSPRFLTSAAAAPLVDQARALGMAPVGVFRDSPPASVAATAARLNLPAVQLHGRENEDDIAALRAALRPDTEIWKAASVGRDSLDPRGADRIVFDHGDGGSGQAFDWRLVAGRADLGRHLIAGGIGSHNARDASALGAFAVDVGSSLDALPGRKSAERIRDFFEALRPASRQGLRQCA